MNFKKSAKYDTEGLVEAEYEPGSRGRVLRNLLGIKKKREMYDYEMGLLDNALEEFSEKYSGSHRFSVKDICSIHKKWLGGVYSWAGKYRQVDVSKGGFLFASARKIPVLMKQFEAKILKKFTPCHGDSLEEIVKAISIVHIEFILIHPFRDGNGRLGRTLAILMALQAGLPILQFDFIKGKNRREYIKAVQAGLDEDYSKMENIYKRIIQKTFKTYAKQLKT